MRIQSPPSPALLRFGNTGDPSKSDEPLAIQIHQATDQKQASELVVKFARKLFVLDQEGRDEIVWEAHKGDMKPTHQEMFRLALSGKLTPTQREDVLEAFMEKQLNARQVDVIVSAFNIVAEKPLNDGQVIRLKNHLSSNPLTLGQRETLLMSLAQDTLPAQDVEKTISQLTRDPSLDNDQYFQKRATRPRYQLLYLREIGKEMKDGVVSWYKNLMKRFADYRAKKKPQN